MISQRFSEQNLKYPKLQVFIYPWFQAYNFRLPSYLKVLDKLAALPFSMPKMTLWCFNHTGNIGDKVQALENNEHLLVIEDENLRNKYDSYLDVNLIQDKYKKDNVYYEKYEKMKANGEIYPKTANNKALLNDEKFVSSAKQMFSKEMSPILVEDNKLKSAPQSYFAILEWDVLKDEGLIYAERLRKNGVKVEIAFYDATFHGVMVAVDPNFSLKEAVKMRDDLVKYLQANL